MTTNITSLPDVITDKIYSFLPTEDVLTSAVVCKQWNANSSLANRRADRRALIRHQDKLKAVHMEMAYPKELRQVFQKNHTPIGQLPVLDLTPVWQRCDYIDFLKPKDVPHPVMRFKDPLGRPGVVLHIREKGKDGSIPFIIFQRYNYSKDDWMYAYNTRDKNARITDEYRRGWNAEMPNNRAALAKISKLLAGEDPEFYVHPPKNRSPSLMKITILALAALAAMISGYFLFNRAG